MVASGEQMQTAIDGELVAFTDNRNGNNEIYLVSATNATPLPGMVTVPGGAGAPGDLNGDGTCEDVNGNGRKDFADVVLFFNQMIMDRGERADLALRLQQQRADRLLGRGLALQPPLRSPSPPFPVARPVVRTGVGAAFPFPRSTMLLSTRHPVQSIRRVTAGYRQIAFDADADGRAGVAVEFSAFRRAEVASTRAAAGRGPAVPSGQVSRRPTRPRPARPSPGDRARPPAVRRSRTGRTGTIDGALCY